MRYGVVFVSLGLLGMLGCEGAPRCPSGMSAEDGRCVCDEPRYFDADGDGYGSGPRLASCELGPSIVTVAGDCDDRDPARHPGAAEVCNGQDDDCDGEIDEDFECPRLGAVPCATACGSEGLTICSSTCELRDDEAACLAPEEVCNGQDDDCDGMVDEGLGTVRWVGKLTDEATLEAAVGGFEGGMVVVARGPSTASLLVVDPEGERLREDRSFDPNLRSPRFARGTETLLLRAVHTSPPRVVCGEIGGAPEFALTSGSCLDLPDDSLVLTDTRRDFDFESFFLRRGDELLAGGMPLTSPAASPLKAGGQVLRGVAAFGVTYTSRVVVWGHEALELYRAEDVGAREYSRVRGFGAVVAADVIATADRVTIAQGTGEAIVLRLFSPSDFACAGGTSGAGCELGAYPAEVARAGDRPLALARQGDRIFVAYTAKEGTALGFLEVDAEGREIQHVGFGQGLGPFVDVYLADVGEAYPRIVARTSAGALHLFAFGCE